MSNDPESRLLKNEKSRPVLVELVVSHCKFGLWNCDTYDPSCALPVLPYKYPLPNPTVICDRVWYLPTVLLPVDPYDTRSLRSFIQENGCIKSSLLTRQ